MKRFRPQVLISLALAVLVSACSQVPEGVGGLEAQFGTALDDVAKSVATNASGDVYALSLEQVDN